MVDLDVCSAGPVPNLDVSGIGVRTAVYVQAIAMAVVISEGEAKDQEDAIRTLLWFTTIFAFCLLYCGLCSKPSITLYDGLYCSYAIVITTLPMIHAAILRERSGAPSLGQFLRYAVVIQAVVAAGTVFSLLLMAASFGSDVSCNERLVVVVFFVTLQALGDGRLVGMTILVLLVLTAIWSVYQGRYLVKSTSTPSRLVTSCILITLSAAILICHAELFLAQNRPQAGERSWASIGQILPVAAAIDQSYRAVTVLMYRVRHLRQQPWFPLCGFIGPPSIFRHFSEVLRSVSGNAIVSRFASSQNLSHQQHHAIAGDNVVPDVSAGGDVSTIDMETGSGHSTQQNARQPSGLPFIRPWLADSVNPAIQEPPTGGIEMAHIENHSAVDPRELAILGSHSSPYSVPSQGTP